MSEESYFEEIRSFMGKVTDTRLLQHLQPGKSLSGFPLALSPKMLQEKSGQDGKTNNNEEGKRDSSYFSDKDNFSSRSSTTSEPSTPAGNQDEDNQQEDGKNGEDKSPSGSDSNTTSVGSNNTWYLFYLVLITTFKAIWNKVILDANVFKSMGRVSWRKKYKLCELGFEFGFWKILICNVVFLILICRYLLHSYNFKLTISKALLIMFKTVLEFMLQLFQLAKYLGKKIVA